jgi:NADH-quinone oxidoreductase subunit N
VNINFSLLLPEFLLTILGLSVLGLDLVVSPKSRNRLGCLTASIGMMSIALVSFFSLSGQQGSLYNGSYLIDDFSLLFKVFFMLIGAVIALMSLEYVGGRMQHPGEYYSMLVFSVLGAVMMSGAAELLTAYISLELLSFSLYVLVALARGERRSLEAGVKYILLGALSSAILLFGISIIYGTMGTTVFQELDSPLAISLGTPTVILGFSMILAGLGFKLAAAPFHLWAPDVYEGAPTPVTAHLSVLSKAAAFALVLRFFAESLPSSIDQWQFPLAVIAALTMTIGNVTALAQQNIKRLLAYSSIGQVGFLMLGLVALSASASNALILHLIGYAFTNLAIFMVVIAVENHGGNEELSSFAGLGDRAPFSALVMTLSLFSLAGLPFLAGFITKFYLFTTVSAEGLLWLAGLAIANSLVSLYYYLRIIRQMYVEDSPEKSPVSQPFLTRLVLSFMLAGTILIGIYPGPLLNLIEAANLPLGLMIVGG